MMKGIVCKHMNHSLGLVCIKVTMHFRVQGKPSSERYEEQRACAMCMYEEGVGTGCENVKKLAENYWQNLGNSGGAFRSNS